MVKKLQVPRSLINETEVEMLRAEASFKLELARQKARLSRQKVKREKELARMRKAERQMRAAGLIIPGRLEMDYSEGYIVWPRVIELTVRDGAVTLDQRSSMISPAVLDGMVRFMLKKPSVGRMRYVQRKLITREGAWVDMRRHSELIGSFEQEKVQLKQRMRTQAHAMHKWFEEFQGKQISELRTLVHFQEDDQLQAHIALHETYKAELHALMAQRNRLPDGRRMWYGMREPDEASEGENSSVNADDASGYASDIEQAGQIG